MNGSSVGRVLAVSSTKPWIAPFPPVKPDEMVFILLIQPSKLFGQPSQPEWPASRYR